MRRVQHVYLVTAKGRGRGNTTPYFLMTSIALCINCGLVPAAHSCPRNLSPDRTPTPTNVDDTGRRLAAVSSLLEKKPRPDPIWADNYWRQVHGSLARQWKHETACHVIPSVPD